MVNSDDKLLIDVGSTYFKVSTSEAIEQHFREFNKDILDDLMNKCGGTISRFDKSDVYICSSANGGLSTLIIGVSNQSTSLFKIYSLVNNKLTNT